MIPGLITTCVIFGILAFIAPVLVIGVQFSEFLKGHRWKQSEESG